MLENKLSRVGVGGGVGLLDFFENIRETFFIKKYLFIPTATPPPLQRKIFVVIFNKMREKNYNFLKK